MGFAALVPCGVLGCRAADIRDAYRIHPQTYVVWFTGFGAVWGFVGFRVWASVSMGDRGLL